MEQPDGSKQADREAEAVSVEDREEFERWQAERNAKASTEVVATIPDSEVALDDDNDPYDKRTGKLVQRDENGHWYYLPEWPHRTFEYKGETWEYR